MKIKLTLADGRNILKPGLSIFLLSANVEFYFHLEHHAIVDIPLHEITRSEFGRHDTVGNMCCHTWTFILEQVSRPI